MPPATWRKWYPHDVEKWNSSPVIQMLSDSAYRAYHSLIMAQWESEDGYLPEDERLLQTLARVREESHWKLVRVEISTLLCTEKGRVFSRKQREEWLRAKAVSERKGRKYPDSGKSVSRVNPASGHNNNNSIKNIGRTKRDPDIRFTPFKELLEKAWAVHNSIDMPWGKEAGANLSRLLSNNPKLTAESFRVMLHNRHKSENVNLAERPMAWISKITDYAKGPLNQYNRPLEASRDLASFKPITIAEQIAQREA